MNKMDIINMVAEKTAINAARSGKPITYTKVEIEEIFNAALEAMKSSLLVGEKVVIMDFGSFEVKSRPQRAGKHPKTGEDILIPASRTISFNVSKYLRENL